MLRELSWSSCKCFTSALPALVVRVSLESWPRAPRGHSELDHKRHSGVGCAVKRRPSLVDRAREDGEEHVVDLLRVQGAEHQLDGEIVGHARPRVDQPCQLAAERRVARNLLAEE